MEIAVKNRRPQIPRKVVGELVVISVQGKSSTPSDPYHARDASGDGLSTVSRNRQAHDSRQ